MSVEAGDLTIWSPQIFETNTFDVISRGDVADRAQVLVRREQKLQAITPLEDVMDTSSATFLACGAFFALSFVTIWAFWFVERLPGASAPHV
jgi:CobQ-like glutamine amidotransferase family enzyme